MKRSAAVEQAEQRAELLAKEIGAIRAQALDLSDAIEAAHRQLAVVAVERRAALDEVSELAARCEDLESQHAQAMSLRNAEVDSLHDEITSRDDASKRLQIDLDNARTLLAVQQRRTRDFVTQAEESEQRLVQLARELDAAREWLRDAQSIAQSLSGDLDVAHRALVDERNERARLASEVVRLSGTEARMEVERALVARLQAELVELQDERHTLEEQLSEVDALRQAIAAAESALLAERDRAAHILNENAGLVAELATERERIVRGSQEIAMLQLQRDSDRQLWKSREEELDVRLSVLAGEVSNERSILAEARRTSEALEREMQRRTADFVEKTAVAVREKLMLQSQADALRVTIAEQANLLKAAERRKFRLPSPLRALGRLFARSKRTDYGPRAWEIRALQTSKLFSPLWYLKRHPDVAAAGDDPLLHYVIHGEKEGRDPHPLFDGRWYREQYPETATSGMSALAHYVTIGVSKGNRPSPLFDTAYYLRQNPDVAASGVNPLLHFMTHGGFEGRNPSPLFESSWYLECNSDVLEVRDNPLLHFNTHGWKEGRNPHPLFDVSWYRERYPDVAQDGSNPLEHFIRHGAAEGRDPHPMFASVWYRERSPEVAAAGDIPLVHYLTQGWQKGLSPHPDFDPVWYLESNPDATASGQSPLQHYVLHGQKQGRSARRPVQKIAELVQAERLNEPRADDADVKQAVLSSVPVPQDELARPRDEAAAKLIALLFDPKWYLSCYPDVAKAGIDPLRHYLEAGAYEGCDPHPLFDSSWYLECNPDVAAARENPLLHFIRTGAAERRNPNPLFDVDYYLDCNPDVLSSGVNPLAHFLQYGWKEKRNPHTLFETGWYLDRNRDVAASGTNPLIHFLIYGGKELRDPCSSFSVRRYLEKHQNVADLNVNPLVYAILHDEVQVSSPGILWPLQRLKRPKAPAEGDWFGLAGKRDVADAVVDIIIPVYRGYDDTLACIYSVLRNRQETPYELVVVNDDGPDRNLGEQLERLSDLGLFTYLRNAENVGFVKTVNTALALHPGRDAILLNSDTVVYSDWIDRMIRHAVADASIATITPFSNNATVCSYPETDRVNRHLLEVPPEIIDEIASTCNAGGRNELPSGVGFCFFMRRKVIDEIGALDFDTFGRGYGEENDFCMRALKAGYKNVLAHDIFVYHTGELSFSKEATRRRDDAQVLLDNKHPEYHRHVRQYIDADPSQPARVSLDVFRLSRSLGRRPAVFVSHTWGGGIERNISDLQEMLAAEDIPVVVLRVGGKTRRGIELELSEIPKGLYLPNIASLDAVEDSGAIARLLRLLNPLFIHVHSTVGLDRDATLALLKVIRESEIPYFYTWHDFAPVCHRNQFVLPNRTYCGEPSLDVCRECVSNDPESSPNEFDPQKRRDAFAGFLQGAASIMVPSLAAKDRAVRLSGSDLIVLRPHSEPFDPSEWIAPTPASALPLRIAVVGAIGPHKGSDVLYEMLADGLARKLPFEVALIGHSDRPDLAHFANFQTSGKYFSDADAIASLRQYAPHICLLPSIWPETYCYTLSLAFRSGVPPVVFDLGAQAERVRAAGWGQVLSRALQYNPGQLNDTLLGLPVMEMWANRKRPMHELSYRLENYYGQDFQRRATILEQ